MPPVGSSIFGSCDIWEIGDPVVGYDSAPLTSQLYPIDYLESVESFGDVEDSRYGVTELLEFESSASILASTLKTPLIQYEDWPAESIDSSAEILSGTLDTILIEYTDWPPESIDSVSAEITSGTLETVLIRYEDWPPESIDSNAEITGGTLE